MSLGSKLAWTVPVVFKRGRSWHGARRQLDGTEQHIRDKRLHRPDRLLAASQSTRIATCRDGLNFLVRQPNCKQSDAVSTSLTKLA